ncbi:MAG TPA: pyroglutamyl-peptidase I [Drouetiella sp.]
MKSSVTRTERCLITGFDAFGKYSANPSQRIAESLPEEFKIPRSNVAVQIDTLVVPTCCNESWKKISKQLSKEKYSSLILVGLSGGRPRISLERFALNIRDYGIKDNNGHQYDGTLIYKGEPDALKTDLPLTDLRRLLRGKKFPVEVSNFAGSFICNEVFYHGLHYQKQNKELKSVLFVHVPQLRDYAKTLVEAKHESMRGMKTPAAKDKQALQVMTDCVQEIASFCSKIAAK